jgi:hypothetical protein
MENPYSMSSQTEWILSPAFASCTVTLSMACGTLPVVVERPIVPA